MREKLQLKTILWDLITLENNCSVESWQTVPTGNVEDAVDPLNSSKILYSVFKHTVRPSGCVKYDKGTTRAES